MLWLINDFSLSPLEYSRENSLIIFSAHITMLVQNEFDFNIICYDQTKNTFKKNALN